MIDEDVRITMLVQRGDKQMRGVILTSAWFIPGVLIECEQLLQAMSTEDYPKAERLMDVYQQLEEARGLAEKYRSVAVNFEHVRLPWEGER